MNRSTWVIAGTAIAVIVLLAGTLLLNQPAADSAASAIPSHSSPSLVGEATSIPSRAATTRPRPPATPAAMHSDFNGDGFADLAIGVPRHNVRVTLGSGDELVLSDAGAVNVLYGSSDGLTRTGNQLWTRDSPDTLPGAADIDDEFGAALASGDFNSDGYADMAVGAPDMGMGTNGGSVNILFGSAAGITSAGNQLWVPEDIPGIPPNVSDYGGRFGSALASGDFDGDGYADLVISYPAVEMGALVLLHGGAAGLEPRGDWLSFAQMGASPPSQYYLLGTVLAAGDLNGDGLDDLAAGAYYGVQGGGEVVVFYGSGSGLTGAGYQQWRQGRDGVGGSSLWPDEFGAALAIGDFDADGFGDLASADPYERVLPCPNFTCGLVGTVSVLRGSPSGLTSDGNQLWNEGTPGVPGNVERKDLFGMAVATGDFDDDGADDLAIGAPGEDSSHRSRPRGMGAVTVLYGSHLQGLTASRAERWTQNSPGVPGDARFGEALGEALSSGQFGRSASDDLVIGVPRDRLGDIGHAGLVNVLYGRSFGLDGRGAQMWSNVILGYSDPPQIEHFGEVFAQ